MTLQQKLFRSTTILICWITFVPGHAQQLPSPLEKSFATFSAMKNTTRYNLEWISLGPTVNSARADIVQVDPSRPGTMYAGFGSGGLWKTTNHGLAWNPIFEEQASLGIGDAELAPSDPSIIYVGTGENLKKPRNFTLQGTGMYRSADGGLTWKHIGLEDSWSIAEIAIHPQDPNIVLVSVLGHLWTRNKNRGLYRTINGGESWEQVLYINDQTGANDVVISPTHPDTMYASLWEVNPGVSGKNSGIYKSTNGGKTWTQSTNGLPDGPKVGRIGLAVSYSDPAKVYALIDNLNNPRNETAELYRTTDGGQHWKKTHEKPFQLFPGIGWYFSDVYVNPQNDEEVYCLGVRLARSSDGGSTFEFVGGMVSHITKSLAQGLHLDQCELWINPTNSNHLALGNDGGFYLSYDKGVSWMHYNNIPTGEFYDITVDQSSDQIFGGTQDDATVVGPSKEYNPNFPDPWEYLWIDPWDGGDGCVTQVDPLDPAVVYYSMQHGNIIRFDRHRDSTVSIQPTLPKESKDTARFNYITPYFISVHNSNTLYHGGNYIFKSVDRGDSWKVISPNLASPSLNEKKSFSVGALAESRIQKGLLFAGTDKGACWVSKDDGAHWEEHSAGLSNNYIRSICPSRFSTARVYAAMTGINYDDLHAYLYSSEDYGIHWKSIATGLPDEPVNVILEDPRYENILYAGCARGMFISINRGSSWSYLGKNMPNTAVADLEVHEGSMDLVVATHGRGIYKTNLKPIHEMNALGWSGAQDYFFEIPSARLPWRNSSGGEVDYRTVERTPISFWLASPGSVTLSLVDADSKELWTHSIEGKEGFNQFRWDLVVSRVSSDFAYFINYDRFLKPGRYTMELKKGATRKTQMLRVVQGASPYLK